MKIRGQQKGYGVFEAFLLLLLVTLLALGGWLVWHKNHKKNSDKAAALGSYEDCVKAAGLVEYRNPAICTKNGKNFTQSAF